MVVGGLMSKGNCQTGMGSGLITKKTIKKFVLLSVNEISQESSAVQSEVWTSG